MMNTRIKKDRHKEDRYSDTVSVVGMAGRFPGARNYLEFWNNMVERVDSISPLTEERWKCLSTGGVSGDSKNQLPQWIGFCSEIDCFDTDFFNISPKEAMLMDPQQRICLEASWSCIEDAGYNPESFSGSKTGVFIGACNFDYKELACAQRIYRGHTSTGTYSTLIPNRVSYFLNLKGPSLAIDTACSSSLVALHEAVASIKRQECTAALVGGVSVLCAPTYFYSFLSTGMLSRSGRCRSFDQSADGYVRGEGVGVVLLKPTEQAIKDKDNIWGIVRGSAVNHGGQATTLTSPNAFSQSKVIFDCYKSAGIGPDRISFMETHGTGTPKGDPIEIVGIRRAFNDLSKAFNVRLAENQCALGAVKTNIGHLESAAGIAGLIKILLALKHNILPGIMHLESVNKKIDLQKSPFYLLQKNQPWNREFDGNEDAIPRLAGVSSFGFGGVNAHVAIEEFINSPIEYPQDFPKKYIFPISAPSEEQLRIIAQQLVEYLDDAECDQDQLLRISYTLQVGRKLFSHRMAVEAASCEELKTSLRLYYEKGEINNNTYRNNRNFDCDLSGGFNEFIESDNSQQSLMNGKNREVLIKHWLAKNPIDWSIYYNEAQPLRISAPTYPFKKNRFWIKEASSISLPKHSQSPYPAIRKILQEARRCIYLVSLKGNESFFNDHEIHGDAMLPGAASVELALFASKRVLNSDLPVRIVNLQWISPLISRGSHIDLTVDTHKTNDNNVEFTISSIDEIQRTTTHTRGLAQLPAGRTTHNHLVDVKDSTAADYFDKEEIYRLFTSLGYAYGETHRGITSCSDSFFKDGNNHVIAEISVSQGSGELLHPELLDCVFQVSLLLSHQRIADGAKIYPYKVESIEFLTPIPVHCKVLATLRSDGPRKNSFAVCDLVVFDKDGCICTRIEGFELVTSESERSLDRKGTKNNTVQETECGPLVLLPVWMKKDTSEATPEMPFPRRQLVVVGDFKDETLEALSIYSQYNHVNFLRIQPSSVSTDEILSEISVKVMDIVKSILCDPTLEPCFFQFVTQEDDSCQGIVWSGISGLLRTASRENPAFCHQVIRVSKSIQWNNLVDIVQKNSVLFKQREVRYLDNGHREHKTLVESLISTSPVSSFEKGVYLISGGTGKLGMLLAKSVAQSTEGSTIVLAGRKTLSESGVSDLCRKLDCSDKTLIYRTVQIEDATQVNQLVKEIETKFGSIDYVFHCAGIVQDNFIINKSTEEFKGTLLPKLAGTLNLDEATAHNSLKHFVCFSSISAELGNPGQSDYATGNAFMDAFSAHRNDLVLKGQRKGHTISINWPLWENGGMQVNDSTKKQMRDIGLIPLADETGMSILKSCLASNCSQLIVLNGIKDKLRTYSSSGTRNSVDIPYNPIAPTRETGSSFLSAQVNERLIKFLDEKIANALEYTSEKIDPNRPLADYGMDSVVSSDLVIDLQKSFGPLPQTLLFEYGTIADLSEYFTSKHADKVFTLLNIDSPKANTPTGDFDRSTAISNHQYETTGLESSAPDYQYETENNRPRVDKRVAIVGAAGRYPGAEDIDVFWRNLAEGRDCVSEIPSSRWNHARYFSTDKEAPRKCYSKWGGFIASPDKFDPLFFNISPREAELIDPQERLFLESAYHCLEDAGYTSREIKENTEGNVGVFVGVMYDEYQLYGGNHSCIANRVSYFFDFRGPSLDLSSMCSSSLYAIHFACNAIHNDDCSMALAGGVNLSLHPNKYLMLSRGRFISSKGRCESFGEGGDGYVPGEGVGVILLKSLYQARKDKDNIYGVIRGSGINHGGRTNGYTVPNPRSQSQAILKAFKSANVSPGDLSYIEAHGTGTSLGDPIEVSGLTQAFTALTENHKNQHCAIGSVKSNIGHLESAAGIAGITKVLLQFKHKKLVPSLHSKSLNSKIDFHNSPFKVQQELTEWKLERNSSSDSFLPASRIAGVSSFGAGGSNAHIVLEEYVNTVITGESSSEDSPQLIVLSARASEQLSEKVQQLHRFFCRTELQDYDLPRIAYTLQVGREPMESRLGFVARNVAHAKDILEEIKTNGNTHPTVFEGSTNERSAAISLLNNDLDFSRLLKVWGDTKKYENILELWVHGLDIDWKILHPVNPGRTSLPLYPFTRKRYWCTEAADTSESHQASLEAESKTYLSDPLNSSSRRIELKASSLSAPHKISLADPENVKSLSTEKSTPEAIFQYPAKEIKVESISSQEAPLVEKSQIMDWLAVKLKKLLFVEEEVSYTKPFIDLGLDSVLGVEWTRSINSHFNLSIEATDLYEHPNIQRLSSYIAGFLGNHSQSTKSKSLNKLSDEVTTPPVKRISTASAPIESGCSQTSTMPEMQVDNVRYNYAHVLDVVKKAISTTLFIEPEEINVDKAFMDIGLDSVLAIELVRSINNELGSKIQSTDLYQYQNARQLSKHLCDSMIRGGHQQSNIGSEAPSEPDENVKTASLISIRSNQSPSRDRIAIIGSSGRYPGASTLDQFWDSLKNGIDCVSEVPPDRWSIDEYYDGLTSSPSKVNCKWIGKLSDIEYFDADFFDIPASEATVMDPQQRLFLEESYHALEDAGYSGASMNGKNCGVYLGIMNNDYSDLVGFQFGLSPSATSNSASIAAARIAYHLNITGSAISIDTACSSALVATHLAAQAIKNGEIDMAVVGGVTLYLTVDPYLSMTRAGMLSSSGKCRAFDKSADGFVPGEGVGVIVLKSLANALHDRDHIQAVIIGSGTNQNGHTNGITAPSKSSQVSLLESIYQKHDIVPNSISYVETHGSGTILGDSIEFAALKNVYGSYTKPESCALGSVKTNLGHTSAASGMAGIHKIIKCIQHKQLVPSLNFVSENEFVNFSNSPFYYNTVSRPWKPSDKFPRRAAVSSFGYSGTNAHIVVEEFIQDNQSNSGAVPVPRVIPLSAQTREQLTEVCFQLKEFLVCNSDMEVSIESIAYTLQVGRDQHEYRAVFIVDSIHHLIQSLEEHLENRQSRSTGFTDEALESAVVTCSSDPVPKDTMKLVKIWTKEKTVNWESLYQESTPMRVSLPTYPFRRSRYWIDSVYSDHPADKVFQSNTGVLEGPASNDTNKDGSLFEHTYQPSYNTNREEQSDHENIVIKAISLIKGIAEKDVDRDANFSAMGISSAELIDIARWISNFTGRDISPADIFDNNSTVDLSAYLESTAPKLESMDRTVNDKSISHHRIINDRNGVSQESDVDLLEKLEKLESETMNIGDVLDYLEPETL